ncbi:hypothetical protein M514_11802 [Trichuris suis]|uniref:Peptidase M12B domain-containing protein n=1 Tax=Trichuris suis TaxID=68888 RepID=A0A085N4X3_9BILA|nr:hypothetical protein M514_11802 [Trichuris suis]
MRWPVQALLTAVVACGTLSFLFTCLLFWWRQDHHKELTLGHFHYQQQQEQQQQQQKRQLRQPRAIQTGRTPIVAVDSLQRQIVLPQLLPQLSNGDRRLKRSPLLPVDSVNRSARVQDRYLYALAAFGGTMLLNLSRMDIDSLLAPGFVVQHLMTNYTWTEEEVRPATECMYYGQVLSTNRHPSDVGAALLNLCDGMYGTVALNDGTYFLEPLEPTGNWSSPDRRPHILYRSGPSTFHDRSSPPPIVEPSIEKADVDARANATDNELKNKSAWSNRRKRSYSREYFVELLVVTDTRMRHYHRHNLENYVLTLLSIVATVFRHPSLEASLSIHLVKLLIVDYENAGPRINDNAQQTLREFCRWQHSINDPDDESANHHDVAVLLTRHDICRLPGKCDTLGLAELGTMCDPFRSCAIIEDNGLSAAFTIAHELGHIFNVPHDDEKKCAQYMTLNKDNYHIMAPTLEFNTHPWSWSPCSTAMLSKFLDSEMAHCMLDKPVEQKYSAMLTANPAPGLSFDANQQCQFVFGPTSSLCPYMPTCKRLWCTTPYGHGYPSGCRTQHMPWADGTPCGSNRWCYRGDCVGIAPAHMLAVDGAWGEWKSWSECSRTCGGGVKRAARECDNPRPSNGGKYCVGERVRHRSCNIKDCPIDSVGFRELQCTEFNGKPVGIYGISSDVRWVPKYNGVNTANRCKLYCRIVGTAAFYLLKDKVVDGTPCGRYTEDICVDGTCRKAGCDNRLGSDLKRDDCGICGGDGTSCAKVSGAYNEIHVYGYNFVTKLPVGASNIDIQQVAWNGKKEDDNYLALQNSKGEFILNGHFQVSVYSQEIAVLGSVIEYSGSDSFIERLNSSRPIMEELFLHVLSVGGLNMPDVRYNYSIPKTPVHSFVAPNEFAWRNTEEWTDCSRICQGSQDIKTECIEVEEERVVDDRYCESLKRPDRMTRACNLHCQTRYSFSQRSFFCFL